MKIRLIIASLAILSLLSCKDEKKEDTTNPTEQIKESNSFEVFLEFKVKKDENIHLYYTEDGSINFNEEKSMWQAVKGSDNFQQIGFTLPENALPTAIRLDLGYGKNPEQSDIELKKFKISYYGKTIEAQDSAIFDYFYLPGESTKRIEGTNKVARLTKDQIVGPILYPNENLLAKIKELTRGK